MKTKSIRKDTRMPPYMMFPRTLLGSRINETTKLLYMVLLDRARLSASSDRWIDREGRVYVLYTVSDLAKTLHKGKTSIEEGLGKLEKEKLIRRKRQLQCIVNKIINYKIPLNPLT